MIRNTFCHLPGIGETTEQRLWSEGIRSWDDAAASDLVVSRCGRLADRIGGTMEAYQQRDWPHFGKLCCGPQSWRWYRELRGNCVYLDIETTGLSPGRDVVTVVACYDGREPRCFVRDIDLEDFPEYVAQFDLMVTYNGASFDAPFLRASFRGLQLPPVHLDLLYPLRRLGYKGGLKGVERTLQVGRESGLREIDGYLAVVLWHRHRRGDQRALPTLLRYAAEDVVSLEPLAEIVFNQLSEPLPLPIPTLGPTPRREVDWPYYPDVLR